MRLECCKFRNVQTFKFGAAAFGNVQRVTQKDPRRTVCPDKSAGNLDRGAMHLARDFLRANRQRLA